jgi:hypothetical protein
MLVRFLRRYGRWVFIACLAVTVFALGYAGHREYYAAAGRTRATIDVAYVTLQLFLMNGADLEGPVGWKLEFARFAAPVVSAYAAIAAALSIFYQQVQFVRPRLFGRHVIVCGLGRRGLRLVEQLRQRGECVVVIDHDANNDELSHCRQLGAIVLVGPANDRWLLQRACVRRAKALVAIMGDDGINMETAVLAHEVNAKRRSGSLDCVVHVFDPRLQEVLKRHRIFTDTSDPFELRFFNTFEIGAQAMLHRQPVPDPAVEGAVPPHLLIVGLGRLGESLLVQAAGDWQARHVENAPRCPLHVTVVDRHAKLKHQALSLRYPQLDEACRIRSVQMDIHFPDFPRCVGLEGGEDFPPVTAAYVCVDVDSLALFAALALHDCLKSRKAPVLVRMTEQAGLASLLGSGPQSQGLIEGVHAVGLLDVTCSLETVFGK